MYVRKNEGSLYEMLQALKDSIELVTYEKRSDSEIRSMYYVKWG
jgi:hypothetical protein